MFTSNLTVASLPGRKISQPKTECNKKFTPNVLVIDSDKNTIDFFKGFLANENCNMITARSLNEAIEKCSEKEVDLVISEFLLGDRSCLEIIMLLKKRLPDLPIAIMDGSEDLISEKDALNFSADYFLSKPLQTEKLQSIIKECSNQFTTFS